MSTILKSVQIVILFVLVSFSALQSGQDEPSEKELQKLREKWLTVKSWSASYKEYYHTEKTWEMSPGLTMKTSIHSTISGTYKLEKQIEDGYSEEEWYGYGNGSSVMDQTVVMTSELPDGTIIITEKTHTASNGAIGIPSKNEYGEYWGGYLSIDIYSGTYGVSFGGPENGKATFSRTVQGLPTDYSSLEDLPQGMREIFVPLGEKAEEWATYSGPLEDAQGIMAGGLAGFELFPDMDEPKEYELPKSGMQLKGSYSGKSITKSWSISPGGENELLALEKTPKEWMPNPKTEKATTIMVTGDGLNGEKVKIRFTLYEVTNETGTCLNSQDDNTELDLQFDPAAGSTKFKEPIETEDGWIIETADKVLNASAGVFALDWGACGKLKAEMEIDEDEDVWGPIYCAEGEGYITIPLDERGGIENHIADQFEINYSLTEGIQTMQDDEGSMKRGDGLTAYEEYRGFMIEADGGDGAFHINTDPEKYINVFVYPDGDGKINSIIFDGEVINNEIMITIIDSEADYVSSTVRKINPNRGDWSVCDQHGLRLMDKNLEPRVLGEAKVAEPYGPKNTEYVAIDLNKLNTTNIKSTTIHEIMHGSGVHHHGKENAVLDNRSFPGKVKTVALWNGINAGDIGCVMQYGWANWYYLKNGGLAESPPGYAIKFQNTTGKIIWNYLCNSKEGTGNLKSNQLGPAEDGNCLSQVRVTDE